MKKMAFAISNFVPTYHILMLNLIFPFLRGVFGDDN